MTKPIIPWIGGKRRLASRILPLFPDHGCYVEPFCGAAALYFLKVPAKVEVLNDVNGELVNLYRVVQHHLEEFVRQFKWALTSRKIFKWLQATPPEPIRSPVLSWCIATHRITQLHVGSSAYTATITASVIMLSCLSSL